MSARIQAILKRHWPEFSGEATSENGLFVVYLMPACEHVARRRAELSARSIESYEAALLDLATWTPPTLRCSDSGCVLCGAR
jgi:hypothetical protein